MQGSFRSRLFFSFLAVIVISLIMPALYTRHQMRQAIMDEAIQRALSEAYQLRSMLSLTTWDAKTLPGLVHTLGGSLGLRMTLISPQGTVVGDSDVLPENIGKMDDHNDRPEVVQALATDFGSSVRQSGTLGNDMVYAAIAIPHDLLAAPLNNGGILRVAVPLATVHTQVDIILQHWLLVIGGAVLTALALSMVLARRIEAPIHEMIEVVKHIAAANTTHHRLHMVPGKEFFQLADAVNNMADRIETSMHTIAEHKAQLETILEVMEEGVLVIGAQGRIRMVNAALVRLFPQAGQAVGRHPVEVITSAELQKALDALLAHPAGEAAVTTLQIEPRRDVFLSVHLVRPLHPVHDVAAVAVFHNVTELMRLMQVRRDFVANVSHELRTPLTAIQGYAETLADLPPDDAENSKRFIATIRRHAEQMSHMVEDLLTLARLESTSLPLDVRPVNLRTLALQAADNAEQQATARKLHIVVDVDEAVQVPADSHFISQVLRNLLENACRYGEPGTSIDVQATTSANSVLVTVRDHGPGIAPEALARIFERFYRVELHRGGAHSTGLGLAICKHIVERHGGRIWAENTPGATMHFVLPLHSEATEGNEPSATNRNI